MYPPHDRIRAQFPALTAADVLLDNAGGSQVPRVVADRIREYMLTTYVQLGADYATARASTRTVAAAHEFVETLMNCRDRGRVILGSSTTMLLSMLADAYSRRPLDTRNEIVVSETGHEANIGPWVRLKSAGFVIRWWRIDPDTQTCSLEELARLLSERTLLVAFPHTSNLLGRIEDVGAVTAAAHRVGAKVVVDGVAYAPHRAIDVAAWNVDWYSFSTYKVYGPHLAALYGTHEALAELEGPNHFFIPRAEIPYKFEPGGVSHEGCAAVLALGDYLRYLGGSEAGGACDRTDVTAAYDVMTRLEQPLQERLLGFLAEAPRVTLIGPAASGPERVPTVSFTHSKHSSRVIAVAANEQGFGIRYGHFYAYRLCQALELDPDDGVVRVSCVHYNSLDEIERLIDCLQRLL